MQNSPTAVTDMDEYGLPALPTGSTEKDNEILALRSLLKQEKSHFIWKKQAINLISLTFNIIMNICRKIIFTKCSAADWITISLFLILMCIAVIISVKNVSSEQTLK